MNRRLRDNLRTAFVVSAGWLFADLLLALAMLFLAANTVAVTPPPTPTPTPRPTAVRPTPRSQPPLDLLKKHRIVVYNVDYASLIVDHPSERAVATLAAQIKTAITNAHLDKRRAGLVIAYGFAPDNTQTNQAAGVAREAYNAIALLDKQGFSFFHGTIDYDALFTYIPPPNCHDLSCVVIDLFLFTL